MTSAVRNILAQIDSLDEAQQEELQAALRLRAVEQFERQAQAERERFAAEGLTEEDIDRAVHEVRYGKKRP